MSKLNITPGKIRWAQVECSGHWQLVNGDGKIIIDDGSASNEYQPVIRPGSPNAEFIAEAFNVANESGLMPRELLAQRDALLAALDALTIQVGLTSCTHEHQRQELQKVNDAARATFARVRGAE